MKPMQMHKQQGFTLIELMIVVAIIAILAAIAIPAYQDYTARAQASEAVTLLGGLKTPIVEYYNTNGAAPDFTQIGNATRTGKYVANITANTTDAIYTATFKTTGVSNKLKNGSSGATIVMTFNTTNGTFSFSCASLDAGIKPKVCN